MIEKNKKLKIPCMVKITSNKKAALSSKTRFQAKYYTHTKRHLEETRKRVVQSIQHKKKRQKKAVLKIHTHTTPHTYSCCLALYVARLARKM